jgi:hypothetical protein
VSEKGNVNALASGLPPLTALDHGRVWLAAGEQIRAMEEQPQNAEIIGPIHALALLCLAVSRGYIELTERQHRPSAAKGPTDTA